MDASKARQLSLFEALGLAIPATRVVHRRADLAAAAKDMRFPLMVKANIGGSGAGMVRYETYDELVMWADDGTTPTGVDGVALVQEYAPARDGRILRCETLNGRFLYALALDGAGSTFDLCPADVCAADRADKGVSITISRFEPPPEIIAQVEAVAQAAKLDLGGIEYLIDDRDGTPRFFDINALSNFVANPVELLGYDPHEKLVDFLETLIVQTRLDGARKDGPAMSTHSGTPWGETRHEIRLLGSGVRRLAAQREGRGDGGQLGLYLQAVPPRRADRL